MLAVEHYELIRRQVLVEGLNQRAVAQALGHSRKAVALRLPPEYRLHEPWPVQGILTRGWSRTRRLLPSSVRPRGECTSGCGRSMVSWDITGPCSDT